MSEKRLSVALVLRLLDQWTGPLRGALRATEQLDRTAGKTTGLSAMDGRVKGINDRTMSNAMLVLNATRQLEAMDAAAEKTEGLKRMGDEVKTLGERIVVAGAAVEGFVGLTVFEYAKLEHATVQAKLPFMSALGTDPRFAEIAELADKVSDATGATREDLLQTAAAMKLAGTSIDGILNGGLATAGKLSVVLDNMPGAQVGEMASAIQQSLAVADADLPRLLDLLQRVRYYSGVDASEFADIARLSGTSMRALGVEGFEGTKGMTTFAAALFQAGLRGRALTPVLRGVITALPTLDDRLKKNADVSDILRRAGISLRFFDDKGKFLGFENFVAQIGKLNKLSIEKRGTVLEAIGPGAAGGLAMIAKLGTEGFRKAQAGIDAQASLDQRFAEKMGTIDQQSMRFHESVAEMVKTLGMSLAPAALFVIERLNGVISAVTELIEQHPVWTRVVMVTAAAAGALAIAIGSLTVAIGVLAAMQLGRQIGIWRLAMILARLEVVALRTAVLRSAVWVVAGFQAMAGAAWSFTIALLANPVTWIVAAIIVAVAALAFAIYHWWGPISTFVDDLWAKVEGVFSRFGDWLMSFSLFAQGVHLARSLWDGFRSVVPDWMLKTALLATVGPAGLAAAQPLFTEKQIPQPPAAVQSAVDSTFGRSVGDTYRVPVIPTGLASLRSVEPVTTAAAAQEALADRAGSRSASAPAIQYSPTIHLAPGSPAESHAAVTAALDADRPRLKAFIEQTIAELDAKKARTGYSR